MGSFFKTDTNQLYGSRMDNVLKNQNNSCWATSNNQSGQTDAKVIISPEHESTSPENCMVCGSLLEYIENEIVVKCTYCAKEFKGYIKCPNGHCVCDMCHNRHAIQLSEAICASLASSDPIEILFLLYAFLFRKFWKTFYSSNRSFGFNFF